MNTAEQTWSAQAVIDEMKASYELAKKRRANLGFVWVDGAARAVIDSYTDGYGDVHTYVIEAAGAYLGKDYIERFRGEWTRSIGYGNRRSVDVREGFGPAQESGAFFTSTREERLSA